MELDQTRKNDLGESPDFDSASDAPRLKKELPQKDPLGSDSPSENLSQNPADEKPIAAASTEITKPSRLKTAGRRMSQLMFSSLTRRIIFLNLSALAVLLSGILYLNQFREGLVEAYKDSLVAQGKIIAGAISASATIEINSITVDPDKLLELQAGESSTPSISSLDDLSSPIDPEIVAPLVRSLVQPNRTRARIYDQDGVLILDSKFLYAGGQVLRFDLPDTKSETRWWSSSALGNFLNRVLQRRDLPTYEEHPNSGIHYPEVVSALTGAPSTIVRMTKKGEQVISVAVPIQRLRIISGVLLLSSEGNEIDKIVTQERLAILRIFLVAAIVLIVLSVLMASTIASPLRRLSDAANRVRKGVESREEIPDFSNRHDEIGTLSTSIRAMTNALYLRIEAIEKFAADVSHELKNPLTSLRSAVETLPLAKSEDSKRRLHEVIQHDVRRLDRLITDISDASRLDAELAREKSGLVDIAQIVENIISMARESRAGKPDIKIDLEIKKPADGTYLLMGHEDRLAQVIINLIDNAKSFVSPDNGAIQVSLSKQEDLIEIVISDNGPGISAEKVDRVFERFYTDRPESQGFGQNSGLGLSISRQIIDAHGGEISVRNKTGRESGAVFLIRLPSHRPTSENTSKKQSVSRSHDRNA
jgi:two-component system sensor histidine kinase ChvG